MAFSRRPGHRHNRGRIAVGGIAIPTNAPALTFSDASPLENATASDGYGATSAVATVDDGDFATTTAVELHNSGGKVGDMINAGGGTWTYSTFSGPDNGAALTDADTGYFARRITAGGTLDSATTALWVLPTQDAITTTIKLVLAEFHENSEATGGLGTPVTAWPDASSHANDADSGLSATATKTATGVYLPTATSFIGRTALTGGSLSTCTRFTVCEADALTGAGQIFGGAGLSNNHVLAIRSTNAWGIGSSTGTITGSAAADTDRHVHCGIFRASPSTEQHYVDGTLVTDADTGDHTADGWRIGRSTTGMPGVYQARVDYNGPLSSGTRAVAEAYLNARYL